MLFGSHLEHFYSLDYHETLPVKWSVQKTENCDRKHIFLMKSQKYRHVDIEVVINYEHC